MNDLPANQDTSNRAEPQADSPTNRPIVINSSNDEEPTREARKQKRRRNFRKAPIWVEAGCAILLVGITGFYTYYARQQKNAMLDSNNINRESLQSVQRAFIRLKGITSNGVIKRTDKREERYFDMNANWENSGNTPATETIVFFSVDELQGEPDEAKFRGPYKSQDYGVSVVGAKGSLDSGIVEKPSAFFLGDQTNIPQANILTRESNRKIYFWGWVAYRDVFPATAVHITEVCQQLTASFYEQEPGKKDPVPRFNYQGCHHHNCVDKYCDDYDEIANMAPK